MSRSSFSWPLAIIAGFAVFMAMLLVGSLNQEAAAQDPNCTPYPGCFRTAVAKTATAGVQGSSAAGTSVAQTSVARTQLAQQGNCIRVPTAGPEESYPCPATSTATNSPTSNTGGGGGGGNTQPTATSTFTPTATSTDEGEQTTPTDDLGVEETATFSPTATDTGEDTGEEGGSVSPTPTTLLPAGVELLTCVPGSNVELSGSAAPNTPLLLLFGERTVGGGLSNSAGAYRLRLQVGEERPGVYLVEVREREGRELVGQFGCEVPPFTPTPTVVR